MSRAPGRGSACDALETRAVAHHGELAAVAARITLVALEPSHFRGGQRPGLREAAAPTTHWHRGACGHRGSGRSLGDGLSRLRAGEAARGDRTLTCLGAQ